MLNLLTRRRRTLGSMIVVLVATMAMPAVGVARIRSADHGQVSIPFRTVHVGNVSLAYRSFGHGRPLVLIQGSGAAMDVWDPLMIAGLAAERRVIVFDNRGVGGSTDDPSVPMTIDLLAQDTAGLIKALHLRRADVLGWSLGGYVAQRLVELHPGRVRRLVLISTDPGGPNAVLASADVLALDARVTTGQASIDEILSLLFPPDQLAAGQAWLERYLSQSGCCESVSEDVGLRQLDAETGWQTGPGAWDDLVEIHRPTLILRGALDIDVPPVNEQLIAARIPNAKLVTFEDAGHGLPLQEPTLVAGVVNGFLSEG
jgi:pimeloyl-ACP methyl ester carboxylesterase